MSRKPAAPTAKITTADVEAAERDRVVAMALRRQQAMAMPPPLTAEQEQAARLFDRLEARSTAEELANRLEADRLAEVARRNAQGAEDCRAYAARMAASGYKGWTGGDR
jgi:hypothetical protein